MSESVMKNPFDVIDEEDNNQDNSMQVQVQDILLPQEVEQALKKIVKRGSTTRAKGFSELLESLKLIDESEIYKVTNFLKGTFVKIFQKFSFSAERGNRLSVAELFYFFISKSDPKTFLQPILKDILTLWLMNLFDPLAEVSNLYRKTLESVFPANTKLKLLLELYEKNIWNEIGLYSKKPERFQNLKEIVLTEMEGNAEDAESVVELIKTEIIGVLGLLLGNNYKNDDKAVALEIKSLLFLKDKEIGSSRRSAIYKFTIKFQESWLIQYVQTSLNKESSPTALIGALELLEKTENKEIRKVVFKESFTWSVLANAPVSEFKKFSTLLIELKVNDFNNWIIKICNANNIMNKERFLSFWKDICGPVLKDNNLEVRKCILERLLFANQEEIQVKTKFRSSGLTSFSPLTVEETMRCICEEFEVSEIVTVCEGKTNVQAAFALSFIENKDEKGKIELERIIKKISLIDLQGKELMKAIPLELLTARLIEPIEGETLGTSETIRLIQALPYLKAIAVLEGRKFDDWEKMLKSNVLSKATIKNVLFKIDGFKEHVISNKKSLNNLILIECAFESNVEVFDCLPDENLLEEALNSVFELNAHSPLLKMALKEHLLIKHTKITTLKAEDRILIYREIELENDPELFNLLNCQDEEFYPIGYVEQSINGLFPVDPIEVLMYKNFKKSKSTDFLLKKLLSFPLKKFENQQKVSLCAFLNDLKEVLNFEISEKEFNSMKNDLIELYAASKVVHVIKKPTVNDVYDFKSALLFHNYYSKLNDVVGLNSLLDEIIFDDAKVESFNFEYISLALSIEPILFVRSDNLSGLINRLVSECERENKNIKIQNTLLLLASLHLNREDLKKEFWRVQFREVFKKLLHWNSNSKNIFSISNELSLRVAAGFWNLLNDPEIEILKDCQFEEALKLKGTDLISNSEFFESIGRAKLILGAAPFVKEFEFFTIERIKNFFESETENEINSKPNSHNSAVDLAMRSVYLQLHLDEQLVKSSVKLETNMNSSACELEIDDLGLIVFPFYKEMIKKQTINPILIEIFVSAIEGSREDSKLLAIFAEIVRSRLIEKFHGIEKTLEVFDFTPREFCKRELMEHVLHRLCAIFPLIVSQNLPKALEICGKSQEILQRREIERIRRQPRVIVDSVEINLRPILTSTTRTINLRVKFIEEIELVMDLLLPGAFPLEIVQVEGREKSGLSESKWKAALLSLQALLRSPTFSGNLFEVVRKWQSNALKLFQGLEECAVCYCVLHPSDKSLPGPACKQCKHKFHATCLYKWFKSSGNATCPLCRALF